jgi:molecular chaperone DnaK
LSEAEVERMRQEAELYAEDDDRRRQLVTLKNQADSLFYSYESTLRDSADFITDDLRRTAAERVSDLRAALANRSVTVEEMKASLDALQQVLYSIGEAVYQQAAATSSGSSADHFSAPSGGGEEYAYAAAAPWASDSSSEVGDGNEFTDDETITADYEAVD